MDDNNDVIKNAIRCTNVPNKLLLKSFAKEYFQNFGTIRKIAIKPKSKICVVMYESPESAEFAIMEAGEFDGATFTVEYLPAQAVVKHSRTSARKDEDPDWPIDPEVQAELDAMSSDYGVRRSYNLRAEAMNVDVEQPVKKERSKTKRLTNVQSSKQSAEYNELIGIMKQPAFTIDDKFKILDARDKLLRLKHHKKQMDLAQSKHTVGVCNDMCPEKERLMREIQHQVAAYEQEADKTMNHKLAVKQYSRSSADQESPLPHELRNVGALQMTMNYLMHRIMNYCDNLDVNFAEWYHFLWDRTRAIRKDITQQELCCLGSVELVEQCARFHIHCSARLVAEDPSVFDQKINTENLTKCLQTLKYMYHDLALKGESCANEAEFRAYIILLNLNDGNFMWEVQKLRTNIQRSTAVRFALDIYSALDKNNYVKFFKLVRSTSYLNACILLRYFIQVRIRALRSMLKCYSPRLLYTPFPIEELKVMLAFEGNESTINFLEYYGLDVNTERTHVILNKSNFSMPDIPYMLDRAVNMIESKRNCSVGDVVCGQRRSKIFDDPTQHHRVQNSFDANGYYINLAELLDKIDTTNTKQRQRSSSPMDVVLKHIQHAPKTIIETKNGEEVDEVDDVVIKDKFLNENNDSSSNQTDFFAKMQQEVLEKQRMEMQERQIQYEQQEMARQAAEADKRAEYERFMKMEQQRQQREQQEQQEIAAAAERSRIERQQREAAEAAEKRKRAEAAAAVQEAERRRKLEQQALKLEQQRREAAAKREQEIHKTVCTIVANLIDQVAAEDYKTKRLNVLKQRLIVRKILTQWQRLIVARKRKRKAIDQCPLWIAPKSPRQIADEFYSGESQALTLSLMKRYRYGKAQSAIPAMLSKDNKRIDYAKVISPQLFANYSTNSNILYVNIYWKVNFVLPVTNSDFINNALNDYLGFIAEDTIRMSTESIHTRKVTCCFEKMWQNPSLRLNCNGCVYIVERVTCDFIDTLRRQLEYLARKEYVPIFIIAKHNPDVDVLSHLKAVKDDGLVNDVKIMTTSTWNFVEAFDAALKYLSEHNSAIPNLQLNTLSTFLVENLGGELWQRVRSFAKWNVAYKECLKLPRTAIRLYNDAIERLKSLIFNDDCYEYADFPAIFHDVLPCKIPDHLPCDYKYFPTFWKDGTYRKFVHNKLDELKLPEYCDKWPLGNDQSASEASIYNYCVKTVSKNPEKTFYKIMAYLLSGDTIDVALWTDIIEIIALDKINLLSYNLEQPYVTQTIFNQLFVVYDENALRTFKHDAWFYLTHPVIQSSIDMHLSVEREEDDEVDEEEPDLDLDAITAKLRERTCQHISRSQIESLKMEVDELQQTINLQKKIGERLNAALTLAVSN